MNNGIITITQVLILLLEIGTGYLLAKRGRLPQEAMGTLTYLCTHVALPCSVVQAVAGMERSVQVWRSLLIATGLVLLLTVVQLVVSSRLFAGAPAPKRAVYQMAGIYGNAAFMGIPLITAMFGSGGVVYATLMVIIDTVFLFVHGALAMSDEKPDVKFILSKVFGIATISVLIGLVIHLSGMSIPPVINTCMTDLKGMLTPLAMFIVGAQLAQQKAGDIFREKANYQVACLKLIIWPLVVMAAFFPFRAVLSPVVASAIIICKATPQAAVLGVLADDNGLDVKAATGVIGFCTIISAVTLPFMAGVCQMIY